MHTVAHDLRSPVTNILGFGSILRKAAKELFCAVSDSTLPDDEKTRLLALVSDDLISPSEYIESGCQQLSAIVRGINELHNLGKAPITLTDIDMDSLMRQVLNTFELARSRLNAEIELEKLPPCRGEAERLKLAFSKLVENALNYLSPERPGRIRIRGESKDGTSIYSIEDNGPGIPEEFREKVFGLGKRVSPRGSVKGDGLGLPVARKIFSLLGGEIWLKSSSGMGSMFFVSLPGIAKG
jgi:signal transduction histidine kinase